VPPRPVPRRRGARLLLEALEDRLTPATHTWTGASTSSPHWSDPGNWTGGAPQPGESNYAGDEATLDHYVKKGWTFTPGGRGHPGS
jgi:hypothetical protein